MGSYQEEVPFSVFFEAVPDAMVVVDRHGIIVDVNAPLEKLFGYPRAEMIGNPVEILVPAAKKEMHLSARQTYSENPEARYMGSRMTLTAAHKNGQSIPVDISLSPMYGESGLYVIAAIRDISEIIKTQEETIQSWSRAMDFRDRETEKHAQRVAALTIALAKELGMSPSEISMARQGALLHDIGKIAIPDKILLKPGELTDEERAIMRKHPEYALEMLWPVNFLRPTSLDIPYCHHEKWDGTGYPRQLKGEEIPFSARIFAVVDVWDSLVFDRPYRGAWTPEKAIAYLKEQSGKHFDPQIVEAFLELLNRKDVLERYFVDHEDEMPAQ